METAGTLGVITIDPRSWDGLVVLCAANSYDSVKVADQHIAEQLSRLTPVLYVDPPLSRLTPAKNPELARALAGPRLRVLAPGLARLTPVVQPFPSRPGIASLTTALTARHIRRATSRLGGRVRALICAWPLYPVFGSGGEQVRVYWAQDDFVGGAALLGMNAKQLDTRERRVAAAADLIIAANPVVADTWRGRGRDPVLIPYGADVAAYSGVDQAPLPPDVGLRGPVAGFVGQINDRTDLSLLEAVADRGLSLLLVGPVNPAFEPGAVRCPAAAGQRLLGRPAAVRGPARLSPDDGRGSRALPGQPLQPRQFPAEDTRIPGRGPGRCRNRPAGHSMAGHRPHLGCHHAYGLRRPRRPPRGRTQDTSGDSAPPGVRGRTQLGPTGRGYRRGHRRGQDGDPDLPSDRVTACGQPVPGRGRATGNFCFPAANDAAQDRETLRRSTAHLLDPIRGL